MALALQTSGSLSFAPKVQASGGLGVFFRSAAKIKSLPGCIGSPSFLGMSHSLWIIWVPIVVSWAVSSRCQAAETPLRGGVAKIDITDHAAGPVNDPCFAKALVLERDGLRVALVSVDAVSIRENGRIGNDFLGKVREALRENPGIAPEAVLVNASHCHGTVRADTAELVIQAVRQAAADLEPVRAGAGAGSENRVSENRRLKLKDGTEADMRRAYAMPPDREIAAVGPIDPQIGLLRLDRVADGRALALLYNFACHPIMNPPGKGSSADYPAYASRLIEEALGPGTVAFFVQGCGGDINPVRYKEVNAPPDAEPLGNLLGLSVLRAAKGIETKANAELRIRREVIDLPRARDFEARIAAIETKRAGLVTSLQPTNINFKSFLPLWIQEKISPEYPSHHAQSYLHDRSVERQALSQLDSDRRVNVERYLKNIEVMEELTRLNTNLALLRRHLEQTRAAGGGTLPAEITGLRIGNFRLVTFPGEATVQVGLNIKKATGLPHAFVAAYTNGYIYYAPTAEQRRNAGYAQEDCDTLVAPEWQPLYEAKAVEILRGL